MAGIMDSVKIVNSSVRTALLTVIVGVLGAASYFGYSRYTERDRLLESQKAEIKLASERLQSLESDLGQKLQQIQSLETDVAAKQVAIENLQTAMHLLKTDQRLAQINVLKLDRDAAGKVTKTELEFVELSPAGDRLSAARRFTLPGDVVYIDNWIVKFDDNYIEKGDIERGTSLCLFRRIFSEDQSPNDGFSLDEVGMRPQAYARGGKLSDFEAKLWSEFWEFANDSKKATDMGIRAANGEAISIKVREGKSYSISLRTSGGLSIKPIESPEPKS